MEPWSAKDAHSEGLEAQNGALEGLPVVAFRTTFMGSRIRIRIKVKLKKIVLDRLSL